MNEPEVIHEILTRARIIAVVGLSNNPARSSYGVAERMQSLGYRILPVNPAIESVLGEKSYSSLKDLPVKPDLVNVFRASEHVPPIVDEVIELGIPYLWLQLGVIHEEAAARAEAAGVKVVMDHCIAVESSRLQWERKAE
jgi:predicted CoA-binding protein